VLTFCRLKNASLPVKQFLQLWTCFNCPQTFEKLSLSLFVVAVVVSRLDLKTLPGERVEILRKIAPNEQELKMFTEYERSKKPIEVLADEDKFVFSVSSPIFTSLFYLFIYFFYLCVYIFINLFIYLFIYLLVYFFFYFLYLFQQHTL